MIYITQGHEKSISLEIFIKCLPHFKNEHIKKFRLVCFKKSLKETLNTLSIKYQLQNNSLQIFGKIITCFFLEKKRFSETQACLDFAIKACLQSKKNILLTLPSSKDQFQYQDKKVSGHTEYFRKYFKKENILMFFKAPKSQVMLITDHVSINNIEKNISIENILGKTSQMIISLFYTHNFYFSGINPHCGENGQIGFSDSIVTEAILQLREKFPQLNFFGPISGDILYPAYSNNANSTLVYMFHDQGLAAFKSINKFIGANISLGLPFLRLSPDHGTAFDKYGKNEANYFGLLYTLKLALSHDEKL